MVETRWSPAPDASAAAGSVLFEPGPRHSMLVKNESATVAVTTYATFVVPVGAAPLTITTEHLCNIEG